VDWIGASADEVFFFLFIWGDQYHFHHHMYTRLALVRPLSVLLKSQKQTKRTRAIKDMVVVESGNEYGHKQQQPEEVCCRLTNVYETTFLGDEMRPEP
jgi:fatty acid desaturase